MNNTVRIGAFVLETLTTGMYANPLDCIREYVQNASDAILSAERYQWLKTNTGIIQIDVNKKERSLTIRDNGTGQSPQNALERLLNIGMSAKVYGEEAGFRGIGRLAGIAYCEKLTFMTTTKYSDESVSISFDCANIRKALTPDVKGAKELSELLHQNVEDDIDEAPNGAHWFEVRLENIDPQLDMFLDYLKLEEYLCQVAPVEFDSQRFVFAPKIQNWAQQHNITIPSVKMFVRTSDDGIERQIFKPYGSHYSTRRDNYEIEVKDVLFFPSELSKGSPAFWMWYAKSDLLGMFGDNRVAGLRFRRHNIAIGGPERMVELFPGNEGRLNGWTIGEVHILTDDVIPNARRDGFEATEGWAEVKKELAPFIREHCKACHAASSSKFRPTQKVLTSAKTIAEKAKKSLKTGLTSIEERGRIASQLEQQISRVEKSLNNCVDQEQRSNLQSSLTSLNDIRGRLDNEGVFASQKLKSNLDRKQRKVIKEVLNIIDTIFSEVHCKRSQECLEAIKEAVSKKYQD